MKFKPRAPCRECGGEVVPPKVIYCSRRCCERACYRNWARRHDRAAYHRERYKAIKLARAAVALDDISQNTGRRSSPPSP